MGFTEASGKASCRWVAVRHGLSKDGNDHIHIALSLVREDGTKASVWNDFDRAQKLCNTLERKHGLQVLESREAGTGSRGYQPAELAKAERTGAAEPARAALARTVRAAAVAAGDEAEFVRRLRGDGVLVRPRYAAGRDDVVAGYSVAARRRSGQRPVWYGGGHLDRDLTLPRLRTEWPDTPQHASAAVAEWNAAKRQRRPVAAGRERLEVDPALWRQHTAAVEQLRERLRSVPIDDRDAWARVAQQTAGAFAAWSARVEAVPGPLAATADVLARSAQIRAHQVRPRPTPGPSARGAALLLASVAHGGKGGVAEVALLRQLANTARAIHDAHRARGEARTAAAIAEVLRGQLATVATALPAADTAGVEAAVRTAVLDRETRDAVRVAGAGQTPLRAPSSPVPTPLTPHRTRTPATPQRGRDDFEP